MQNTIFYADDDADDLEFFKEVTTEIKADVALFEEGDKMLTTLNNPPPNASVIFLDLNMPIKSGFQILNEIKATPSISSIPVIILTTSVNPEDIAQCKHMGANLYIRKPTTIDGLKKAITFVLSTDWGNFRPNDREFVYRPS